MVPPTKTFFTALLALLAFLSTDVAPASSASFPLERPLRVDLGFGGGSTGLSEGDEREFGPVGNLHLGWAIHRRFVLGFDGNVWWKKVEGTEFIFGAGGFAATWYPAEHPAYLRAVLGFGQIKIGAGEDSGFGLTMALGYEFQVNETLGIGPRIDFRYVDIGDLSANIVGGSVVASLAF